MSLFWQKLKAKALIGPLASPLRAWQKTRSVKPWVPFSLLDASCIGQLDKFQFEISPNQIPCIEHHLDNIIKHEHQILGSPLLSINRSHPASHLVGSERVFDGMSFPARNSIRGLLEKRFAFFEEYISGKHEPIDWSRDFVSGLSWPDFIWYREARKATPQGADIKVPWELGRLQHLPAMGFGYGLGLPRQMGPQNRELWGVEFQNELCDFLMQNPRGFTVNWACTMDVAMRIANILLAYDLFIQAGYPFGKLISQIVSTTAVEHGRHIFQNLERSGDRRNNHYLANIVGLLFVCRYLPNWAETPSWQNFAVPAFFEELEHQFSSEGTLMEGSTYYHRMCTEMCLWATALIFGSPTLMESLPNKARPSRGATIPTWLISKLDRMVFFLKDMTRPDGRLVSLGDNDSGAFIRILTGLRPAESDGAQPTRVLDDITKISSMHRAMRGERPSGLSQSMDWVHAGVTRALLYAQGKAIGSNPPESSGHTETPEQTLASSGNQFSFEAERNQVSCYEFFTGSEDLATGLSCKAYPEFGVYIFRSSALFMTIRCGPVPENWARPIGHFHLDQLSVTLFYRDIGVINDPGSLAYTRDVNIRNRYRSMAAHFTLQLPPENDRTILSKGAFSLLSPPSGKCVGWSDTDFLGHLTINNQILGSLQARVSKSQVTLQSYKLPLGAAKILPVSWVYGEQDPWQHNVPKSIWDQFIQGRNKKIAFDLEEWYWGFHTQTEGR